MTHRFMLEMPWTETLCRVNESVEQSATRLCKQNYKTCDWNQRLHSVRICKANSAVVFNKIMTSRLKRKLGEIGVDTSSRKVNENFCLVCELKRFTFELAI